MNDTQKLRALSSQFMFILRRQFGPILSPNGTARDRSNILNRIPGYLSITSTDTNLNARMNGLHADELTYENLLHFLEDRIFQSDRNVNFNALRWTFVITPSVYVVGAGGRMATITYPKNLYKLCHEEHSDEYGPINCAAFALNYRLYFTSRNYARKSLVTICRDARAFQTLMGWGEYVNVTDIRKVIDTFTDIRLTILIPNTTHYRETTYEGADFDTDQLTLPTRQITSPTSKVVYLVFDFQHYFPISSVQGYLRLAKKTRDIVFCHTCIEHFRGAREEHDCENWIQNQPSRKKKRTSPCEFCGKQKNSKTCTCGMSRCFSCKSRHQTNERHRCILVPPSGEREQPEYDMGSQEGKKPALWAYDIESRVSIIESENELIDEFEVDPDLRFTGKVTRRSYHVHEHVANLLVAKNVFTNEMKIFEGDNCITEFLFFLATYNKGENLCYAHNASGYDTRLIFGEACKINSTTKDAILRGCKFMQFKTNHITFRDTLLHLQGSLRGLAKSYCSEVRMEKGYFPHMFNSVENYDYVGPIPPIDTFDLTFVVKDDTELQAFETWYHSWDGRNDWNFRDELRKYCINDVDVLAAIMVAHHNILVEKFEMSPWINMTAPSYVHEIYLRVLHRSLELPDPKDQPQEYNYRIQELAEKSYWAVLKDPEYLFAREALRGGRTDIRKVFHRISQEAWDRGERGRYQDICSQYPYQQAVHDFPTGIPTIHVWDSTCNPCYKCPVLKCIHTTLPTDPDLKIIDIPPPNVEELLTDEWFGIVCCTIDPPKDLYHPVLVCYDEDLKKCVASCKLIEKKVFTSIEFQQALKVGYRLITLHRFDKYHRTPSLWSDVIKDLFIEKMVNSSNEPSPEKKERLIEEYERKFGMGDDLRKTFREHRWGKNPAKKLTFKVLLNSGWGKHCQKTDLTSTEILDRNNQEAMLLLFDNFAQHKYTFNNVVTLSADEDMYLYKKDEMPLEIHKTYLAAGLFVPAYGRLHLWKQLHLLGDRVLMNDTDSIIYVYDPTKYNIPEGDIWGDWEVEDKDRLNGGIREFVGVGPKTYSILCENGETETKCKGLRLSRATENLVNHETMRALVINDDGVIQNEEVTSEDEDDPRRIRVPQQLFSYVLTKSKTIQTRKILKDLCFQHTQLKGNLDSNGFLYPFGYEHNTNTLINT
ncbi:DNA polymerase [Microcoleus sp. herbarium19]|uniref:DNA polymerase n=1 Tax=Microcoleus sp. herbarium19 TaxID=3055440 RepID=UPI002FD20FF2